MSMDLQRSQHMPPTDATDDFGCRHVLEIGAHLRNLAQRADTLTVSFDGGAFETRILDVRPDSFVFEASRPEVCDAPLVAPQSRFVGEPDGVHVEFAIGTPRLIEFQGRPAFEADFPAVLYYMQRRAYFRVVTPAAAPFLCVGALDDGTPFSFELADLSMSGIGVRTADPAAARLVPCTQLSGVELQLGQRGLRDVTLELMSVRPAPAGGHLLGFRFAALPLSADNTLQRVITELAVGQP